MSRPDLSRRTAHWLLRLYAEAGEAGGSFVTSLAPSRARGVRGEAANPDRSRAEAARRARGRVRRYCTANRLNRLGTLTYAGEGCHDPRQARRDVGAFFRRLRASLGGAAFPYLWVTEWHKTGHGLHVHFAVGTFIARSRIEAAWRHGFVHIKLLGDLPIGATSLTEARRAAGYLGKYVGKSFHHEHVPGLRRFDVAEGFQPRSVPVLGSSWVDVLDQACEHMGAFPERVWRSADQDAWQGPPAVWAAWA